MAKLIKTGAILSHLQQFNQEFDSKNSFDEPLSLLEL